MRLINEDDVLNRITNPYERAIVSRWTREAPTIEAVPVVHGRWIPWKKWNEDFVVCSECKLIGYKNYDAFRPGYASNMNYCPNCGAHMKGEQDDND